MYTYIVVSRSSAMRSMSYLMEMTDEDIFFDNPLSKFLTNETRKLQQTRQTKSREVGL